MQNKEDVFLRKDSTTKYGRGGWTRTNGCQDQNLMPYQLGDAPMSFKPCTRTRRFIYLSKRIDGAQL